MLWEVSYGYEEWKNIVIRDSVKVYSIHVIKLSFISNLKIIWEIKKYVQIKAFAYGELIYCYINLKKIRALKASQVD